MIQSVLEVGVDLDLYMSIARLSACALCCCLSESLSFIPDLLFSVTFHWKKCSTKNMLITLKTDKYLLEISSMHLTQVQYDLDIDYTTLVLIHAYFFKDKCTFLRLYKSKLK